MEINLQNALNVRCPGVCDPDLPRSKLVDGVDDLSSNSLTIANQLEIRTLRVRSKLARLMAEHWTAEQGEG